MNRLLLITLISILGCTTTPTAPTGAPVESTSPAIPTETSVSKLEKLVMGSACAKVSFKSRGVMPAGFAKGVARVYARQVCKYKSPASTAAGVSGMAYGNPEKDALAWYGLAGSPDRSTGLERLTLDFSLLYGLGLRESSGNYGEGYDKSAGPEKASEAEAGAFQFSFNSIGAHQALRSLFTEYQAGKASCLLSVFREGARGDTQGIVGSGDGADFQAFTKKCPAFQTEYAAVLIRVLRKHFGPLNRKEAELRGECFEMLKDVEKLTDAKGCGEFL